MYGDGSVEVSTHGSVEVSVPTDLTVTSDGDSEDGVAASRRHIREVQSLVAEKANLQRTVEKQNLELLHLQSQITALTSQHEAAISRLSGQKDDQISTKQVIINRLEAELTQTKLELHNFRERAARELAHLTQKCATFQENHKKLSVRHNEIRASLSNLQISESEMVKLRSVPSDQLSLRQFTALRLLELVWPLKCQINELETVNSSLETALNAKNMDLKTSIHCCEKFKEERDDLQTRVERFASQVINLKDEQRTDDFKIHNFDRIKNGRDVLEDEKASLSQKYAQTELALATLKKEKWILDERYNDLKLKARKQEQELSQAQADCLDLRNRLGRISEEVNSSSKSLKLERERSEDLHEKYISSRGEVSTLVENLRDCEHDIKLSKDRLHIVTLQNTQLEEKLDHISKQSRIFSDEAERYKTKYEKETSNFTMELQELRSMLSNLSKNREELISENMKLHQDIQSGEVALHDEKILRKKDVSCIQQELDHVKQSLDAYENLEKEYEQQIKMAASVPEKQSIAFLDRLTPGLSIVGKRAVSQSVQMTRKVLQLERENVEAYKTIKQLTDALEHLKTTIKSYKSAFNLAGKPSSTLLEKIASQEDQIATLQSTLQHCSRTRDILTAENKRLMYDLSQALQKFEHFETQYSELSAIKSHLHGLQASVNQMTANKLGSISSRFPTKETSHQSPSNHGYQFSAPKAIVITKASKM
ncbi:unnamed protein product, partial [Meganyctiphanes norvegica]